MYCLGASSIQCLAINSDNIGSSESYASFIMGDANADGTFDISDVVLLQKWLLAVPNTELANWKAIDYNHDNILDVFDLVLMKRAMIQKLVVQNNQPFSISGKTFVYENEGIGSPFTITFNEDGTYMYYEGVLSSYIGAGSWNLDDDIAVLTENIKGSVIRLKVQNDVLTYIESGSDNFYYIHVKDGERFIIFQ